MRKLLLGTVRARLMTLLAIAAVPLMTMSALVAWQGYAAAGDQAKQIVLLAREAASARHEAALTSAQQLVAALARSPRIWTDSPAMCSAFLEQIAALGPDRYGKVVAVEPDGIPRCASGDAAPSSYADQGWFDDVRASGQPIGGRLQIDPRDSSPSPLDDAVVVAYPLMSEGADGARFDGALAIFLRLGWFTHAAEILPGSGKRMAESWLMEPRAGVLPVGGAMIGDLPEPAALPDLLDAGAGVRLARSAKGELFAYAVTDLPDSLKLLSGFRAQDVIGPARHVLILRFAILAIVMVAGMAIVAMGANQAVAKPVKTLTKAVRKWRADAARGGAFDPGPTRRLPAEILELSQAFSETTGALAQREEQLRVAAGRQDLLMKEIHHRVKNNLQIVASLLNLQANRITLPAARAEFQSARDRVRALATLHRHLYSQGDLHTINMRGFLTELCGQLFQAMGESEGDRIHLDIEAPELTMSTDQATPLSLIVTEAVSNSLKYAFPDGRAGAIAVRLTAEDGIATLVIEDDGVGIPAGKAETETGTRDGLGRQLIVGFARQLGAELQVEQAPEGGSGTRYSVTLQLRHDEAGVTELADA